MPGSVPIATLRRSGVVEATHLGSVAVVHADGAVVASAGDPGLVTFARSSTKPLQACVSLEMAGGAPTDREVAVMCASHGGEPVHLEEVRSLLARSGLGADALLCPPGLPLDPEAARSADAPARELHNCSGKHAGMLLACVRAGHDASSYDRADHPLQRRVARAVGIAAGGPPVAVGIDGCGLPVHAFPLARLAGMYARLTRPDRLGELAGHAARAVDCMRAHPYLVAGRGRVCTDLMSAVPGLLVKVGAEGLLCVAVPDAELGIAVKVADGSSRALGAATVRTLRLLGVVGAKQEAAVEPHARPPVLGGGRRVGELVAEFDLRS